MGGTCPGAVVQGKIVIEPPGKPSYSGVIILQYYVYIFSLKLNAISSIICLRSSNISTDY